MKYDEVVAAIMTLLAADGTITGVVGTNIREAGEADFVVPSLEWTLIVETPADEMYHRIQLQFDPFTRTSAQLVTLQGRLNQLFHQDREWTLGTIKVRSQLLAVRREPAKGGVQSGGMDFEFLAVRER